MWPLNKYGHLVSALPPRWKIAVLGLPGDLRTLKKTMPASRPVEYVTGTIRTSLETLASAKSLLVMDSGNMHFAQVLGVPAIAMFGSNPPSDVIELDGCVEGMYWRRFPCQPCRRAACSQPEIYCLNSVEPDVVAGRLKAQWDRLQEHMSTPVDLVHISNP
jgi:heptosyltransferase-2